MIYDSIKIAGTRL